MVFLCIKRIMIKCRNYEISYATGREAEKMKKANKLVFSLVLVLSMTFMGCGGDKADAVTEEKNIMVDVMTAEQGTLTLSNQFVGTIAPQESVYVIPMAQGKVTNTYFQVGDMVQAGAVLFEIDDSAAKMQLEQAQLTYNNARLQADNALTTQMDSTNAQLETQLASALAQLQAAQMQYVSAKDGFEQVTDSIESVENGIATFEKIASGELVVPAEQLAAMLAALDTDPTDKIPAPQNVGEAIAMLKAQLKELQELQKQTAMSRNTTKAAMEAAEKGYNTILDSINVAKGEGLEKTKEQLQTSLELAKLGVDSAKLALSYYDVTAPISGKIIAKSVETNGFATSSQPAYIIANDQSMTVTFHVSESVKNTLAPGAELVIERNGVEFKGAITEVGNAVNQQTGLFQIKGSVYANGEELPSGVSVKISVETYRANEAVIIPYDAVYYENEGAYVYLMKDGVAVKSYVTTGIFDEENIEIITGIALGDEVIISWSPRLIDGAAVEAAPKPATK